MATAPYRLIQKVWLPGIVCLLLGLMIAPILREWTVQSRLPTDIVRSGNLRVGLDPSRPPLAYFDANGDYQGLEIDLAEAIVAKLNLEVTFIPLGFDGLIDALQTNQVDIVIAGLQPEYSIDRNGVLYTHHYFNAGLVFVSTNGTETARDLPGKRLAYEFGSEADELAHRWLRQVHPFELRPYELPSYALDAVEFQAADVALVDALTAHLYIREYNKDNWQIEHVTDRWYTIAIREGRNDLYRLINDVLNTLHNTGTLDNIIDNWL